MDPVFCHQFDGFRVVLAFAHRTYRHLFRTVGDKAHIGFALCNLGDVALQSGEHQRALAYYGQYLQIMYKIGYTWPTFYALADIAALLTEVSHHAAVAVRLLGTAHTLRQETGIDVTAEQQANYEQVVTTLRQQLGDTNFEHHRNEGSTAPLSDLVTEATHFIATTPFRTKDNRHDSR